jgi:hypothetical protein
LDAIAEAAEEEVKEKVIDKEYLEIESIKDNNKNGSYYSNTKNGNAVGAEHPQDEPTKEESKAASPKSGFMNGKLEAAELANDDAHLAIHGESNPYVFEVANGSQIQIEDVIDQVVDDEADEAIDLDQLAEEDRNSEETNERHIGSESESA